MYGFKITSRGIWLVERDEEGQETRMDLVTWDTIREHLEKPEEKDEG